MATVLQILDSLSNWYQPQREALKLIGYEYGLGAGEDPLFDRLWPLARNAQKLVSSKREAMAINRDRYFGEMRSIADGLGSSLPGLNRISRNDINGKYVIFSDMHMLHRGHRHDYFHTFKNDTLYKKVLEQYATCDFTLVENGDVEELLIFEPTLEIAEAYSNTLKNGIIDFEELNAIRKGIRMGLLDRIINDNEDLYDHINNLFHKQGKYIRLTGNHDTYEDPDLVMRLQAKYTKLAIKDVLALHPMADPHTLSGPANFLITHGHQFDVVTCPLHASRVGELISECLSWIFQGPDRNWKWNDDVKNWVGGTEKFKNNLAESHPENAIQRILDILKGEGDNELAKILAENIAMGHEIAWEYFESPKLMDAIANEVLTGNEFFKIRHLNEELLAGEYSKAMLGMPEIPKLVLGHSHEVRHNSLCTHGLRWPEYFNSGSAGRFENMLFAVEVENGVGKIVSWHNEGGPSDNPQNIQRRIWNPNGAEFEVDSNSSLLCPAIGVGPLQDIDTNLNGPGSNDEGSSFGDLPFGAFGN